MKYDLIIVSQSSTPKLQRITQSCINSALKDEVDLNIIIVETSDYMHAYNKVNQTIKYEGKFNYNHALNLGIKEAKGDVFILANNDIIFNKGWSHIGNLMLWNGYDSASGLSGDINHINCERGNLIYEGYRIGFHITGWCIFCTRKCIETIGQLDESMEFWYSDNIYADQLQEHKLRHGLFCNIRVDHLGSQTLNIISRSKKNEYSFGAGEKYNAIKNKKSE